MLKRFKCKSSKNKMNYQRLGSDNLQKLSTKNLRKEDAIHE